MLAHNQSQVPQTHPATMLVNSQRPIQHDIQPPALMAPSPSTPAKANFLSSGNNFAVPGYAHQANTPFPNNGNPDLSNVRLPQSLGEMAGSQPYVPAFSDGHYQGSYQDNDNSGSSSGWAPYGLEITAQAQSQHHLQPAAYYSNQFNAFPAGLGSTSSPTLGAQVTNSVSQPQKPVLSSGQFSSSSNDFDFGFPTTSESQIQNIQAQPQTPPLYFNPFKTPYDALGSTSLATSDPQVSTSESQPQPQVPSSAFGQFNTAPDSLHLFSSQPVLETQMQKAEGFLSPLLSTEGNRTPSETYSTLPAATQPTSDAPAKPRQLLVEEPTPTIQPPNEFPFTDKSPSPSPLPVPSDPQPKEILHFRGRQVSHYPTFSLPDIASYRQAMSIQQFVQSQGNSQGHPFVNAMEEKNKMPGARVDWTYGGGLLLTVKGPKLGELLRQLK